MALGVKFMSRNMGFDLGTANIVVYVDGKGIVLREPTMVAVRSDARRQVLAVGEEAKKMMGRTPSNITAIHPVTEGVIAGSGLDAGDDQIPDPQGERLLRAHRAPARCGLRALRHHAVERQAVEQVVRNAGARSVHLVDEPMAAAIARGSPWRRRAAPWSWTSAAARRRWRCSP